MKNKIIYLFICVLVMSSQVYAEDINDIKERMEYTASEVAAKGFSHTNTTKDVEFQFNTIMPNTNSTQESSKPVTMYSHKDILNKEDLYAEIKQGEPYKERFEAMAGVPSKEKFFVDVGADLVKADYDYTIEKTQKQENFIGIDLPVYGEIFCSSEDYGKLCEFKVDVNGMSNCGSPEFTTFYNELKNAKTPEELVQVLTGDASNKGGDATKFNEAIEKEIAFRATEAGGAHEAKDNSCGHNQKSCSGNMKASKEGEGFRIVIPSCCFQDRRPDVVLKVSAKSWKRDACNGNAISGHKVTDEEECDGADTNHDTGAASGTFPTFRITVGHFQSGYVSHLDDVNFSFNNFNATGPGTKKTEVITDGDRAAHVTLSKDGNTITSNYSTFVHANVYNFSNSPKIAVGVDIDPMWVQLVDCEDKNETEITVKVDFLDKFKMKFEDIFSKRSAEGNLIYDYDAKFLSLRKTPLIGSGLYSDFLRFLNDYVHCWEYGTKERECVEYNYTYAGNGKTPSFTVRLFSGANWRRTASLTNIHGVGDMMAFIGSAVAPFDINIIRQGINGSVLNDNEANLGRQNDLYKIVYTPLSMNDEDAAEFYSRFMLPHGDNSDMNRNLNGFIVKPEYSMTQGQMTSAAGLEIMKQRSLDYYEATAKWMLKGLEKAYDEWSPDMQDLLYTPNGTKFDGHITGSCLNYSYYVGDTHYIGMKIGGGERVYIENSDGEKDCNPFKDLADKIDKSKWSTLTYYNWEDGCFSFGYVPSEDIFDIYKEALLHGMGSSTGVLSNFLKDRWYNDAVVSPGKPLGTAAPIECNRIIYIKSGCTIKSYGAFDSLSKEQIHNALVYNNINGSIKDLYPAIFGYNGMPDVDLNVEGQGMDDTYRDLLKYYSPNYNKTFSKVHGKDRMNFILDNGYLEFKEDPDVDENYLGYLPWSMISYDSFSPSGKINVPEIFPETINNLAYEPVVQERHIYTSYSYNEMVNDNFVENELRVKDIKNGVYKTGSVKLGYDRISARKGITLKTPRGKDFTIDFHGVEFNPRNRSGDSNEAGCKYINKDLCKNSIKEGWDYFSTGRNKNGDYYINKAVLNDIVIHNPSSVQFSKVLTPPDYMDQRVEDNIVYKGGDSMDGKYAVTKTTDNSASTLSGYSDIKYIGNHDDVTDRRQYYNYVTKAYDDTIEERRKKVSFVNLGREFEIIVSDQMDITKDEYGVTLDTKTENSMGRDREFYVNEDGDKIYSYELFGLPECSGILGYGWGHENMVEPNKEGNDKHLTYTSMFPYSDKYEFGMHNYVKDRYIIAPFDLTLIDKNKNYITFKKGQMFNLDELYIWTSDNENQKWNNISDLRIKDTDDITGTQQIFKHKGTRHPDTNHNSNSNDTRKSEGKHKDRLIYGICLLTNEERANNSESYLSYANNLTLDSTYGSGIVLDDRSIFKYNNAKNDSEFRPKEGAYVLKFSDIVGLIGNLTLNDTADFRSANFFKESLGNDKYYVEGGSSVVDVNKSKNILTQSHNIYGDVNYYDQSGPGKNCDVWSTQLHKSKYVGIETYEAQLNEPESLKTEQLKPGYAHYYDVETVGNYDSLNINNSNNKESDRLTNRVMVKPLYYLYYKDDDGTWKTQGLKAVYMEGGQLIEGCSNDFKPGDDNFGTMRYQITDDMVGRYNCTEREQEITNTLHSISEPDIITSWLKFGEQDTIGTTNLISLDSANRDYIGSSSLRGAETIVEGRVNHTDGYESDIGSTDLGELNAAIHVQKNYFQVGLPTGVKFVERNVDINSDITAEKPLEYWTERVTSKEGFIVESLKIQAYGPIWSLQMKQDLNNTDPSPIPEGKFDPLPKVNGGANGDGIDVPDFRNPIPVIMDNKTTASDDFGVDGLY